ncbi:MAG: hypothetical protein IRY99_01095 [Isosphaeraceae bacterium]|nr:hypothetical protein [Isosphaeraceae bacterium]
MLPNQYKIRVYNDAGVDTTVQVDWRPYHLDANGINYATLVTPIASQTVASATQVLSTAIDNSAAKNLGGHLLVTATPSAAPSGNQRLLVYLLGSNDGVAFEDQYAALGEGYGSTVFELDLTGTGTVHRLFEVLP